MTYTLVIPFNATFTKKKQTYHFSFLFSFFLFFFFFFFQVNFKEDTLIEVDNPAVEEKQKKSDMKNGPNTQKEVKANNSNSTLTTMCSLF